MAGRTKVVRHLYDAHYNGAHCRCVRPAWACISTVLRDSGALAYFLQPFGSQLPGFRAVAASGPKYPISLHA
jgi:hypothetical protein